MNILWDHQGIASILKRLPKGFVALEDSFRILEMGPFKIPRWIQIKDKEQLREAEELGYPLVMKTADRDIVHKSDVGGVITGIRDERSLLAAFNTIKRKSSKIMVMEQVSGVELIAGALRDPVFGPVVMFGLGGTLVEVTDDVVFRVAPLTIKDATDMLEGIKGNILLEKFRGNEVVGKGQLNDLLLSLSEIMLSFERIDEIEVNPLFLTEKGPIAVDARIKLSRP